MKIKIIAFFIILNIVSPVLAGTGPRVLTLTQSKEIAMEKNPSLASAMERVNQAKESIAQARAAYLPILTATAGWEYAEETSLSSAAYAENNYTNRVSATQVLFNGFYRKYSSMSARFEKTMNQAALDEARRLLTWSVAQTYLNAQLTMENIKIARSDIQFNQNQEKEARAKEKAGTGSFSDLLNFQTKVNTAKVSLISYQQDYKESIHGLAALMGYETAGLPKGITLDPLDTTDTKNKISRYAGLELNQILDSATLVDSRPDLKQASLAIENSQAKIEMVKSEYFPDISLTGSYGTNGGQEFRDLGDDDTMGASIGVEISFEFFSGGATQSRVREAVSVKRASGKDLENAKLTAISDIRSSADNIGSIQEQLTLQKENTRLIETTRDLVKKEYTAGQASLVRLNETQNDLVSAMGDLAIARVSLILALEQFDYYTGRNIN